MDKQDQITWQLGNMLLGRFPRVEISEERFKDIESSRTKINAAIDIEELWDAVVRNYRAYELAQASLSIMHMTDFSLAEDEFDENRRKLSVHVNNLLSTTRAFLDVTPQRARNLGGDALMKEFKAYTNHAYDASKAYQFMEALRNYSQHNGAAITGLTLGVTRSDKGQLHLEAEDWKLIHTSEARVDSSVLRDHFKAKNLHLLDHFRDKKGMIAITPLIREYVQGINQIVLNLRAATEEIEKKALEINASAEQDLDEAGASKHARAAIKSDGRGVALDQIYLSTRGADSLSQLRNRNGSLQHLTRSTRHA